MIPFPVGSKVRLIGKKKPVGTITDYNREYNDYGIDWGSGKHGRLPAERLELADKKAR